MGNNYKFAKSSSGKCSVLHREDTLFGKQWVTLATFKGCEVRMRKIAKLLNECEEISNNYGK